jgi:hypothetical protein
MRGHRLVQTIVRVNSIFHGKVGGPVMDYLSLAHELQAALGPGRGSASRQCEEVILHHCDLAI